MLRASSFFILSLLFLLGACSSKDNFHGFYKIGNPYQVKGKWYYPKKDPNYVETGQASWYGPGFHGRNTANGDDYKQTTYTAAHRTLPLPSVVRITNLRNNRSVIAMVNDRGPFSKNRIIDVSKKTAGALGFVNQGVTDVKVEFLQEYTENLLNGAKPNQKIVMDLNLIDQQELAKNLEAKHSTKNQLAQNLGMQNGEQHQLVQNINIADNDGADDNGKDDKSTDDTNKDGKNKGNTRYELAKNVEQKLSAKNKKLTNLQYASLRNKVTKSDNINLTKELDKKPIKNKTIYSKESPIKLANYKPKTNNSKKSSNEAFALISKTSNDNQFFVQAGSFKEIGNAQKAEKKLQKLGEISLFRVNSKDRKFYRVSIGPINDRNQAEYVLSRVVDYGHKDAKIVNK